MRNRNSLKYRVLHWFYQLNKNDFKKVLEEINVTVAFIVFFVLMLIVPHIFH